MRQTLFFRLLVIALVVAGILILYRATHPPHVASVDKQERLPDLDTPPISR